jgi:hypothetical protein
MEKDASKAKTERERIIEIQETLVSGLYTTKGRKHEQSKGQMLYCSRLLHAKSRNSTPRSHMHMRASNADSTPSQLPMDIFRKRKAETTSVPIHILNLMNA